MIAWRKMMVAAVAPLFLTGCLWTPGKFASSLMIRKDGSFTLDYKGEILLQGQDEKGMVAEPWSDSMGRCFADGRAQALTNVFTVELDTPEAADGEESYESRPCTKAELAALKAKYEKEAPERIAERRRKSEETAKLFGLPGADEASNRRFAESMMKFKGWRSVQYVGSGKFTVDYHFDGKVGQDFAFPVIPNSDLIFPFILIRQRNDGSVVVTAPALTGGSGPWGTRAKMLDLPDSGDGPVSHAEGRFTIITDGEILTNNSEDGPVAHPTGRQVRWDVDAASDKIPEMLVRL